MNNNCISNILENILLLQERRCRNGVGCAKEVLGDTLETANTRPINLYTCCNNAIWTMPYDYQGTTGESTFFRIESVNNNTATFRILINNAGVYTATDNFFIIDLDYVSCIKCLQDTTITTI